MSNLISAKSVCQILLYAVALSAVTSLATAEPVAIVVNARLPVSDLSFDDVRKLFLGERQLWTPQLRVVLLMRAPAEPGRDVVLRTIYRMTEGNFQQYWISKVFRTEVSTGPKIVYSTQMLEELVAAIPGAVGFLNASEVTKALKVLKVDGKLPGDKAYPLR